MPNRIGFLSGVGLGAGLMYAFDPNMGRRRRAMARDRVMSLARCEADFIGKGARDLAHRVAGRAEQLRTVEGVAIPDRVLDARVRSALGRVASHPSAIRTHVKD